MGAMVICICKNVNSHQLRECLQRGMSLEDISEEMGLGTGCGRCLEYACNLIEQEIAPVTNETAA